MVGPCSWATPTGWLASTGGLSGTCCLCTALSRVVVGDGRRTSFWRDSWLPCGPVEAAFRVLFTHTSGVGKIEQCPRLTT